MEIIKLLKLILNGKTILKLIFNDFYKLHDICLPMTMECVRNIWVNVTYEEVEL